MLVFHDVSATPQVWDVRRVLASLEPAGWHYRRKFYDVCAAVTQTMQSTSRSSSPIENLNSRLRTCLTSRRHLDGSRAWLGLLQFFFSIIAASCAAGAVGASAKVRVKR